MLVKLQNDWFDGQVFHKKGVTFEYNGDPKLLPRTAVVLSDKGLPLTSTANTPKPGFGAKPVEEQILDMVGAGPTHQIETGVVDTGITPAPEPTEEEKAKASEAEAKAARTEQQEAHDKDVAEARKETEAALIVAEKAVTIVEKANDPFATLSKPKK